MKNFELLKRTYPISKYDRYCDGYNYIFKNSTLNERKKYNYCDDEIQKIIKKGEKYIYQVGKENRIFKVMCISFKNYEIIRKMFFGYNDE